MSKTQEIDITGQKFGKLLAVHRLKPRGGQGGQWLFRCDCGKEKAINGWSVRSGRTESCGCKRRDDLTGKRFGRLTALKIGSTEKKIHWIFLCDCGTEKEIDRSSVVHGNTVSCGCYNKEILSTIKYKDIAGQRAGFAVAVKPLQLCNKRKRWVWECLCDCGNRFESIVKPFTQNLSLSCGCKHTNRSGERNHNWKGGKSSAGSGYIAVIAKDHPFANRKGRVLEHRLVMENKIGRFLFTNETVHHKNGNRSDNRIENLELWASWQPFGQRTEDLVEYALEILKRYAPEAIAK